MPRKRKPEQADGLPVGLQQLLVPRGIECGSCHQPMGIVAYRWLRPGGRAEAVCEECARFLSTLKKEK